jgi:hypothetical protein
MGSISGKIIGVESLRHRGFNAYATLGRLDRFG